MEIEKSGKTQPTWWKDVVIDVPASLDMSYPAPIPGRPKPWDNQKNIGQFVWDVVNPNPSRWRSSGILLFHRLLREHQNDPEKRSRVMNELGSMYFRFEQDYARAAFWWEKAGVGEGDGLYFTQTSLAECYWRLGSKEWALEILGKAKRITPGTIKLLGDMGETEMALKLAREFASQSPTIGNLYAGDLCRKLARDEEASKYYEKSVNAEPGNRRVTVYRNLAASSLLSLKGGTFFDLSKAADGVYHGECMGYDGPVNVEISIGSGKIDGVSVVEHREKQYYSSIRETCRKIKEYQGVQGVDATSGATVTSQAIRNAAMEAMRKACSEK